ncbi:MAG: nascent polypeptide-associated complex protein [archaeon GB-1867-097]|nr:nascent polypeptide-associated complex protein [Candidatus Culexmicrobium thermophilum]MCS7384385.1 nascent polypeptide-associated complex protein [Candidatus Culexmicrobium thermophilum]HDO20137.1 NagC family transcriptional regulator [Candidatus Bathyarchaeota archaeon]
MESETMRRMSPREMRRLMRKLGMQLNEIEDVEEVTITRRNEIIKVLSPKVSMMKIGEETIFQIVGEPEIVKREEVLEIPEEDVQLVAAQTGVTLDEARRALIENGGDLAKAILTLTMKKK